MKLFVLGWGGQNVLEVYKVNFIVHPLYAKTKVNDIGIIRNRNIQFSKLINKVNQPKFSQETCRIFCGWCDHSEWLHCNDEILWNDSLNQPMPEVIYNLSEAFCGRHSRDAWVIRDYPTFVALTSFEETERYVCVAQHLSWISQNTGVFYI